MKRKIIRIDEDKCDGCGLCATACAEGAIKIVDGKARLVSETYCDGLGACLGECPRGAISMEEREAPAFDEKAVHAHLTAERSRPSPCGGGCPSARALDFGPREATPTDGRSASVSELSHWPVQLHLVSPAAPHFQGADLLLAADCTAYALGGFHEGWLKGRKLAIACPKLDEDQEVYAEKLKDLIDGARINTLTVMIMQVPCCSGLLALARKACAEATRKVPLKCVVVGLRGDILREEWL